jgi:hypothetical protein
VDLAGRTSNRAEWTRRPSRSRRQRARRAAGPIIVRLAEHADRAFADRAAFNAHLDRLGLAALRVNPDPVLIATEGALLGSIKAHGLLPER